MAEGRNAANAAGKANLRWWQQGSTEKKPSYFVKDFMGAFLKKQAPIERARDKYWDKQYKLIADRNVFYKAYNPAAKEPKATFKEAMQLSGYGYTGLYASSKSKQTIGLLGEEWQRAYALDKIRNKKDLLSFSIMANTSPNALKEIAAAEQIVPGTKKYNNLLGLYDTFVDKYGATGEGYVKRYDNLPAMGTKYGLLFNTDIKSIKRDDANVTYNNNLVKASLKVSKELTKIAEESNSPALQAAALRFASYDEYRIKSARGKYNPDRVKEMEEQLDSIPFMIEEVSTALNGQPESEFTRIGTGVVAAIAAGMAAGPSGVVPGFRFGFSEGGNKQASKTIDLMNGYAASDVLKGRDTYWRSFDGGLSQFGLIGFGGNITRGIARLGAGAPTGIVLATDEGYLAGVETKKWATKEDYAWGTDVDFKLGDAIWADYAERYYDVFAYDESGRNRGWFTGLKDPDAWDAFGRKFNEDPVAYALDILDVAPLVGFATKAAHLAALTGSTSRVFGGSGRVGVTNADRAAWKQSREVMTVTEASDRLANIQGLEKVFGNKADQATINAAEAAVNAAKFDAAPNARTWRKTVRAAYNGDPLAAAELSRWRAIGLEFDGLEKGIGVRATALFEPRTRVLDKPESVAEASPLAVYRLPASPIARAAKEGFFWVGRGFDSLVQEAAKQKGLTGRVGTKLIDMPLLSYRYNYTKAVRNEAINEWGDINTEMSRAANLLVADRTADVSPSMRRAIIGSLFGGNGFHPLQLPAIQRQQIQDKINGLPRDKETGEILASARADYENLRFRLADLLDKQLRDIDEGAAAAKFEELFEADLTDLKMRLADPTYKIDDVALTNAVELHRKLERQDFAVRSRIFHDDTTPTSIEHLKMLYTEAMEGLRLNRNSLFGTGGKSKGRIGRYTGRVLRVNTNMLLRALMLGASKDEIISLAQKPNQTGTVFDDIVDPVQRGLLEDEMVRAFEALDAPENFIDGMGSYGTPGRPVLILARSQPSDPNFVSFHLPRLRHDFEGGRIINGKLVDENQVFTLPKVFFSAKNKGAGKPNVEAAAAGKEILYEGALNAMARIYPEARYYSAKVNDTGASGVRQNERMIATEHQVAQSGLREHSLSRVIQSQVHYLRSRVERDLRGLAESQAVIIPARDASGRTPAQSGYHVLHNVRAFDSPEAALEFARLRGVTKEVEEALAAYADGIFTPVDSTLDVVRGLGIRIVDGRPQYLVRGGMQDWFNEAIQEDLAQNTTMKSWVSREISDPDEIPNEGLVVAIPNNTYRQLAETVIEADTTAAQLLNMRGVKGWGNLFKWFVLNANPGFISNNIIGGMAIMMMYNPSVAPRLLATMLQKTARDSIKKKINNDWFTLQMSHFKHDHEAISRQLAYEFEHNIYRQDAGLVGATQKEPWFKRYVWHGGYTTVSAWEALLRSNVASQFLREDAGFQAFMRGPEVRQRIEEGVDWHGNVRAGEEAMTPFEAAVDLLLDRSSPYFNANLKHRMRYITNTISGNYHYFTPFEQLMRNVVMPFYSWQRHAATFSYRMFVDRPITTNALYHLGEQGYQQNLEQGVPEWMMNTIPVPQVIKDMFGITDDDFRLDGNMLTPFGTSGEMGMAAFSLLTGGESNTNVFQFGNPYLNALIEDTLGVNPQTGAINWERLKEDGMAPEGVLGIGKNLGTSMFKATYPYKIGELAKYKEYEADALENQYASVDNSSDILKNFDPDNPDDVWRLKIPEMRSVEQRDPTQRVFGALGLKSYRLNPNSLPPSARQDAIGAIVLKYINDAGKRSSAEAGVRSAEEWKRRYDYVMQVWLPVAQAQGLDAASIRLVINKIMDEKPKRGIAKKLSDSMIGG